MRSDAARPSVPAIVSRIEPSRAPSESAPQERAGFQGLDAVARDPRASGFVAVTGERSLLDALATHAVRRARVCGRPAIRVDGLPHGDAFCDLAARLGVSVGSDPFTIAESLIAQARGALVVVVDAKPTAWGRAIAGELASLLRASDVSGEGAGDVAVRPLFLHIIDAPPDPGAHGRALDVAPVASSDDIRSWWEAASQDAWFTEASKTSRFERLDALEGWWSVARETPRDARRALAPLSEGAARLLARVAWSRRSWPVDAALRLGTSEARAELVARGAIEIDAHGRIFLVASGAALCPDASAPPPSEAALLAAAIEASRTLDPWSWLRASELWALAGDVDRAEAAASRAIRDVASPAARADFWDRWCAALEALPPGASRAPLLNAAELAHAVGDEERALQIANIAVRKIGESFDVMLVLGRATATRSDLTTAAVILRSAMAQASSPAERARAASELADVLYTLGDLEGARESAELGLAGAQDKPTRLLARNVVGKLFLAAGRWDLAEQHFAADASEASRCGELIAELRARMNRAVALLSTDRYDESRALLLSVLEVAEARRDVGATAFALTNLSTLAIKRNEYADALRCAERAFELRRQIGDKIRMARIITNLAELRVQVGLVDEAEQALAFGRKTCGPGMPAARVATFALVAARARLARGDSVGAAAEIRQALAGMQGSSNGDKVGECHRVAARVALEDGDLERASASIGSARAAASSPYAKAEVAVLQALFARAAGEPLDEAAELAISLARTINAAEFQREAHVLARHAAAARGDMSGAAAHACAAIALRDRLAASLPDELRARYLARRELIELAQLERRSLSGAQLEATDAACERCGASSCAGCEGRAARAEPARRASPPALRRMVGQAPSMIALACAIKKVALSDATVFVQGESGTGKELVAEAIHEVSPRSARPLIKVNCAALVETLLLSELFGHEKGSFTGAVARKRGRFELAEGGTLFFDEIGDISHRTQVALLRVLQDKTYERIGGATQMRANVRIICATHRDLRAMVARGEFREDLYYRLRGVVLEVPALRQRIGDLPAIASALLDGIASDRGEAPKRLTPGALALLQRHAWPGNVRELENALRVAALFSETTAIEADDLTRNVDALRALADDEPAIDERPSGPGLLAPASAEGAASERGLLAEPTGELGDGAAAAAPTEAAYAAVRAGMSLSEMKHRIEIECIRRALTESHGNITRAASLLGMKRPRLSQLVKEYGLGGVSED